MAILAMDTATDTLAVAVGVAGETVASAAVRVARGHSRLLQPTAARLLADAGLTVNDLTGICVGIGPGSYTGVRLAVSTAKAMAVTLQVPLLTVSTLLAIAEAAALPVRGRSAIVLPLLYARRQRAYGALYTVRERAEAGAEAGEDADAGVGRDGAWQTREAVQVCPLVDWRETWQQASASGGWAQRIVVHDFAAQMNVASAAQAFETAADAVVDLRAIASQLGPALIRLCQRGQADEIVGDAIHQVAPDYALPVEAEVRLAERSEPHGNLPGTS